MDANPSAASVHARVTSTAPIHPPPDPDVDGAAASPTDIARPAGGTSRRGLLRAGVIGGGLALVGGSALGGGSGGPVLWRQAAFAGTSAGTIPEQMHLAWGDDPATSMTISWVSPAAVRRPRVRLGTATGGFGRYVDAEERTYVDGLNGQRTIVYHAHLRGLRPGTAYTYQVDTADRGPAATATPTSGGPTASPTGGPAGNAGIGTFTTARQGRFPFRFTSYGDLATDRAWTISSPNAFHAVNAVERFAPLFHLLNGDLCYANLTFAQQPAVWRDFGVNVARSAANRPWMPALGNHEIEFGNGPHGYEAYLTRFSLPSNGIPGLVGTFYSYRVGSALFVSLDADDVIYQDGGAFAATDIIPANGTATIPGGTSRYNRQYTGTLAAGANGTLAPGGNRQTRWLEHTLATARADHTIDWIIVQMHQCPVSSSATGNGSDLGIRQAWLPLFDRYQVDLVVTGHDHDYERTFPLRGFDRDHGTEVPTASTTSGSTGAGTGGTAGASGGTSVDTLRPRPVVTDASADTFDTDAGTVYLVLGGGGTSGPTDTYGTTPTGARQGKVITRRTAISRDARTGAFTKSPADAVEDAVWSARPDTTGHPYGIAVFDLDPGTRRGGPTTITVGYYHAPRVQPGDPAPDYTLFDHFTLRRPRRD
ncbi:metallophosphoesterase family protein [Frankia sp. R82]|uniref:purple acid phosphatase family protein n=1 Tax=Frankia sp. R82 TaxID=2950553 RepID=UPI00204312B4|nr:metallophosphoesterase family protein [Frankia sp. R82]MCM3883273.1 metallophosphoesterase family protein [Frankia sp. R82]